MRLTDTLTAEILNSARLSFGDVPVYLFGSRSDDSKRGGDIDLAFKLKQSRESFNKSKIQFLAYLERHGIDYPFDLIQYNDDISPVLKSEIEQTGILLN